MKQAAILYALGHLGPRLRAVRKRTWLLAGIVGISVLTIVVWLAVAILSWVWNQAPALAESGRQGISTALDKMGQVAPEMKNQLEPLISGSGISPSNNTDDWPAQDVSGIELPGVVRYPGFVRSHYLRGDGRIELRYVGQGSLHAVLDHYVNQFRASGYDQEVIKATPEVEIHRFAKPSDTVDFEIRRASAKDNIEVVLVDVIN